MADDLTFPVQGEAIDYPQVAAPQPQQEQVIPTNVVDLPDTPLEKSTAARLEGYTWPEIDGHIAQARKTADAFGYTQQQVDDHLGYRDPSPLQDKLALDATARMQDHEPGDNPIETASGDLFKQTKDGLVANPVTSAVRQDYADALNDGQVKSQQDFAQAAADAVAQAAGIDASQAVRPLAAQLPDPRDATDYAIGVAATLDPKATEPPPAAQVNDTRTNMLNVWAETGQDFNGMYRAAHNDPLFQEALTTPQAPGPKSLAADNQTALTKYLQESGETLGEMYRQLPGAFASLSQDVIKAAGAAAPLLIPGPVGAAAAKGAEVANAFIKSLTGEAGGEGAVDQLTMFLTGGLMNPLAPEVPVTAPLLTSAVKAGAAPAIEEGIAQFKSVLADEAGSLGTGRRVVRAKPPLLPEGIEPPAIPVQWRQLDDDLNRLRTNDVADKASIYNIARVLPAEWRTPAFQSTFSHEIETLMTSAPEVSEETRAYMAVVKPLTDRQFELGTKVAARLKAMGLPAPDIQSIKRTDEGYVHRITDADITPTELDPTTQRDLISNSVIDRPRGLSKFASSMQGRSDKMYVFDDGQGNRVWGDAEPLENLRGKTFGDVVPSADGKTWTIARPTMKEVMANTDITYQDNHFVNTAVNVARLARIDRNLDFLENTIGRMKDAGQFISRADWRPNQGGALPPGMIPIRVAGIDGYAAPELARPINDFFGQKDDLLAFLDKSSSILNKSLFISPVPHGLNMTAQWGINRAWDWIKPWDYGKQLSGMAQAIRDVWTMSPQYLEHLRAGSSLPYASVETENFHNLLLGKVFHEIMDDHPTWGPVSRALGFPGPDTWIKSMYSVSHQALWYANDVLKYNREIEYQRRGYDLPDAIRLAEKDMVSYRVPSQVLGSSIASKAIQSPGLFNFGRYKYGLAKSMYTMISDIAKPMFGKGTKEEAFEAIGKASVIVLLSMAIPGLHSILGSRGVMAPIDATKDMWQGQKDWASTVATMVAPGPLLAIADKLRSSRDIFGNALVDPKATTRGEIGEALEQVLGQVYPGQLLINAFKKGPSSVADSLLGTKFFDTPFVPSAYQQTQEQKAAYAHERHDGFLSWFENILPAWLGGGPPPQAPVTYHRHGRP